MRGPCSAVPRYLPTIHAVVETIRGPIFVRRSNMVLSKGLSGVSFH